jgi:hypothetical protein
LRLWLRFWLLLLLRGSRLACWGLCLGKTALF